MPPSRLLFHKLVLASTIGVAFCSAPLRADDTADLKAISSSSQALVARVKKARPDDPRLYFLEAQDEILTGLTKSDYFKKNPAELNWLVRTTRRFMTSLERAMDGKIAKKTDVPPKDAEEWNKVFAGQTAGFWWGSALADTAKRAQGFQPKPYPAPQLDEWFATAFMIAHIDFDLRMSLLSEGVGSDPAFDEVGKIVKAAWDKKSRHPRSLMEFGMSFDPILKTMDPMKRRTKMRDEVKAYLNSKGIKDSRKGIEFKGTPEKAAWGSAAP